MKHVETNVRIRRMNLDDRDAAIKILSDHGLGQPRKLNQQLTFLLECSNHLCLIAHANVTPVGMLIAHFNGFHAYMNFLGVIESHRRRGVATQLHQQLIRDVKLKDAQGIIVDSWLSAVGFYYKLGYKTPGAVFLIRKFEQLSDE